MILCSPQYGLKPNSNAGGEVYDEKILKGLADKGVEIEIILPYKRLYDTSQKNWCVHYLPIPFIHRSYLFNFAIIPQLISIYKKTHFDILRIHSPYYVGIGAWLFKKLFAPKVKLVASYLHFEEKFLFNLIDYFFIRSWDHILTISQSTKRVLTDRYKIPENKINITSPGISDEYFSKCKKSFDNPIPSLVFCGFLNPRKNVRFLIEILNDLTDQNSKLTIIGDGPQKTELKKIAADLKVSHRIIFTGYLSMEEKLKLINKADIFLFPSLMEGFGMSPVEAMACGIPTIVSDRGALPEVVGDGAMALPLDKNVWIKAINHLIVDKELRKSWSQKAISRANKFKWQNGIDETYKLLFNL